MKPLLLSHFTATSCIGRGLDQTLDALRHGRSGLARCTFETVDLDTFIGEVMGVDEVRLPAHLADFDCRNNRLAQLALEQDGFAQVVHAAAAKYGRQRIGVFIGTSTSGILQTELAYRQLNPITGALSADFHYSATHNTFSVADFTRCYFDLAGPAVAVSSACSSIDCQTTPSVKRPAVGREEFADWIRRFIGPLTRACFFCPVSGSQPFR